MTKSETNLSPKQKLFIEKYLGECHFNGTLAASAAGYQGNKNALGVTAHGLLRNPKIQVEIDACLSAMTMPSNVVLARLTEIANGSIEDVLNEDGRFDLEKAKNAQNTHLIKKLKFRKTKCGEEIEVELYSAHEALRDLGKHHKLFTEKHEIFGNLGFSWSEIVDDSGVKAGEANADENLTDASE